MIRSQHLTRGLREETRVELKRIQQELGHTLVYVTHDQEEAMSVADRIAILEHGQIRQIGTPSEIYDRPASRYVAGLLGSPMINVVDLDESGADRRRRARFRWTAQSVPAGAVSDRHPAGGSQGRALERRQCGQARPRFRSRAAWAALP